jgi:uncharacterized protein YfaS (alpha-2-macroglobulin family)
MNSAQIQTGDYSRVWKTIDSLEQKGLFRSAMPIAKTVLAKAVVENNPAQAHKALMYKLRYDQMLSENHEEPLINYLDSLIERAEFPVKNLLAGSSAKIIWAHYQTNQWTALEQKSDATSSDIREWSRKNYVEKVAGLHALALNSPEELAKIPWQSVQAILNGDSTSCAVRPTLFDLLAHQAIEFYMDDQANLLPFNKTIEPTEKLLAPNSEFIQLKPLEQTNSFWHKAILLWQQITSTHIESNNSLAVAEVTVQRFNRLRPLVKHNNVDSLYSIALKSLIDEYKGDVAQMVPMVHLAVYLESRSQQKIVAENVHTRYYLKEALDLCNTVIAQPNAPSNYVNWASSIASRIKNKQLSITNEQIILPNAEWLAAINYRNLNEVFLTIAKIDYEDYLDILENNEREKQIELISSKAMVRDLNMRFELNDEGDYRQHALEVALPPLSTGFYVIIAAPQKQIIYNNTNICINPVWVSNIAWAQRTLPDGSSDFRFSDRKSGRALPGVELTIYNQQYNQYKQRATINKGSEYKADSEGFLSIPETGSQQRYRVKLKSQNEEVWPEQSFYQYPESKADKPYVQTHYFTDRKVYRPGQTVYFKGIAIEYQGENRQLKTGLEESVFLYDANQQVVHKLSVKTNEYGSHHGSFVLPETGLTGVFRIESARGQTWFNVEEYKRPTFSTELKSPDSSYSLGGEITLIGEATALAGFPISVATVNYRVERSVEMPWWRWGRGGWPGQSTSEEVASGTILSDADGKYTITFTAAEPNKVYYPDEYYRFVVTADVVDITGETHSATQSIRVGRNALLLSSMNSPVVDATEFKKVDVTATNLNDAPISASGKVEIYKLISLEKAFKKRMWAATDQHQLSSEEFSKRFPDDELLSLETSEEEKLGQKVFEVNFNTPKNASLKINDAQTWEPGSYLLKVVGSTPQGDKAEFKHTFTLFNPEKKTPAVPDFLWTHLDKQTAKPGESVRLFISSGVESHIWVETELKGKIVNRQLIKLNNQMTSVDIPVSENHRGNFGIHISTTNKNRFYQQSYTIEVPYSNKILNLSLETFRDKMEPGSKENWTLKIKDENGKAVSAEVLATMYDASLDALGFQNQFSLFPYTNRYNRLGWQNAGAFGVTGGWAFQRDWNQHQSFYPSAPCGINFFGSDNMHFGGYNEGVVFHSMPMMMKDGDTQSASRSETLAGNVMDMAEIAVEEESAKPAPDEKSAPLQIRQNFNETAFFQPQLYTDKNGVLSIRFTLPESVTTWKLLTLGHSKSLQIGSLEKEAIAQKTLMVIPNPPRFMRQGDEFLFTGKVVNLSDETISAKAELTFSNAQDDKPVKLVIDAISKNLTLAPGESKAVQWQVKVPDDLSLVNFVMSVTSAKHSDGERKPLAILPNRKLVTESMPMPVYGKGTTTYEYERLLNSGTEAGIKHHRLTLEFSANPAWYAVQALPYMMEYPYDCTEQIFTRFYANSLASHIVSSRPGIAEMFKKYSEESPEALWSNLQKNQELKNVLIEETPWVLNAQNEAEAKKNMALLFDLSRMATEKQKAIDKLAEAQLHEGAWPWFKGMQPSRYITQYLVEGMGRLKYLGTDAGSNSRMNAMLDKAVLWLDREFVKEFKKIENSEDYKLNPSDVHYMYVRSMFPERARSLELQKAFDFYLSRAPETWTTLDLYTQGMLALATWRMNRKEISAEITASLAERSIMNQEQGRFWKNTWGFYWYNLPIETHSLLIELFSETGADKKFVNELKLWLLKQKQVQHWKTTKATANACYALLMSGDDWLKNTAMPVIKVGNTEIVFNENEKSANRVFVKPEPGTGHFKTAWSGEEITSNMGNVSVENKHDGPAWGALYWQYFQDMDKITPHDTPLKITREYFVEQLVNGVRKAIPITESKVNPGNRVLVRIVLETDRDMEYVHLKDQRAAGLEPMESKSGYVWNLGLGYYRSIRDASTNFFFDWLPKGRHVFEYELRANLSGDFTHGIGSVQCMYAPEFAAHSRGTRFVIE